MQRLPRTQSRGVAACLVILGLGIAGVLGSGTGPAASAKLTPAEVIALRFPTALNVASKPAPVRVASADGELFSPYPISQRASNTRPALPGTMLAHADQAADIAPARPAAEQVGSVTPPADKRAAKPPRPASQSTPLFNNAQLASIKERLNLSADQEPYWPRVEQALRAIAWRDAHREGRKAGTKTDMLRIDPNSAEVQQLKSAAIPLIMRLREDQSREVRQMVRVMGLEQLAAQF